MEPTSRRLAVLLLTGIAEPEKVKERLNAAAWADLPARHRELFQAALRVAAAGRIVQQTDEGFLVEFPAASQAVNAALAFQCLLWTRTQAEEPLHVRIGIHQGEVLEFPSQPAAPPPVRLAGAAVDVAARVMKLAGGGQILLTRAVFDDARQYVRRHPQVAGVADLPPLRWVAHGRYVLSGPDDEPLEVCEIGAETIAPLRAPADGPAGRRAVAAGEEDTLGWRPAVGLEIPGRGGWHIVKRLGEGGFGEVWLAGNVPLGQQHVFKFCFDPIRLRSLTREITLFRLLRDALGSRQDYVPLHGINLDQPPYYLESEYVAAGSLVSWAADQGGLANVSLPTRLRLVSEAARAVAAAHSVGIIHRDIKPANILVDRRADGQPTVRLSDFGIGELADRTRLRELDIRPAGFTEELCPSSGGSWTGSWLYAAPEYLMGRPATIQGDIYALGVVLYQMVRGDLYQPLGPGWDRDVPDELLREDIARCVDMDPLKRFAGAEALARSLDDLGGRRERLRQEQEAQRRAALRRRRLRLAALAGALLVLVAVLCVIGYVRQRDMRSRAEQLAASESQARLQARQAQQQAQDERDLAMEMLNKLVFEIQEKLDSRVGMHALRESLLKVALEKAQRLQASLGNLAGQADRTTAYALVKLSNLLQVTGRTQDALAPLEQARAVLERLAQGPAPSAQALKDLVMIYGQLCSVSLGIGQTARSLELAQKELETAQRITGDVAAAQRCILAALGMLGDIKLRIGQPQAALEYYQRGLAIRESAAATRPADAALQGDLATHYTRIGDACMELGQTRQGEEYFLKGLRLAERLADDAQDFQAQRGLAIAQSRLSDLNLVLGRTQGALDYHLQSLRIFQAVADAQPEDTQSQNDLVICLGRLGGLNLKIGKPQEAVEAYEKALSIRRRLAAREPTIAQVQRNLSTACLDMGFVCQRVGRHAQALDFYREALKISQALAEADPGSPQAQRDLSIAASDLGDQCMTLRLYAEAKTHFQKSWQIRQALAQSQPSNATAQRDLALAYVRLGDVNLALQDPAPAVAAYEQALAMNQARADADPANAEVRQDLANSLYRLGGLYLRAGQMQKALDYFQQAVQHYRALAQEAKDAESRHNLAMAYMRLGDVQLAMDRPNQARESYRALLELSRAQAAEHPNPEAQRDLSFAYARMARACSAGQSKQEAMDYMVQSLAIDRAAAKAQPDSAQAQSDLVSSLVSTAATAGDLGKHAQAADCYREAIEVLKRMEELKLLSEGQKDWRKMIADALAEGLKNLPASRPASGATLRSSDAAPLRSTRAATRASGQ